MVSGGPLRMTCHSKGLLSSTKPAEKPESVFLFRSAQPHQQTDVAPKQARTKDKKHKDQNTRLLKHTKDGLDGTANKTLY